MQKRTPNKKLSREDETMQPDDERNNNQEQFSDEVVDEEPGDNDRIASSQLIDPADQLNGIKNPG